MRNAPGCQQCSEPLPRIRITLSCNAHLPNTKHRWFFCSLLCLRRWVESQMGLSTASFLSKPHAVPLAYQASERPVQVA